MSNLENGVMGIHPQQPRELAAEFNVGIDIEEVERFASVRDDATKRALFTSEEAEYCSAFSDAAARYAGTWCAKEAAVKALWPWVRLDPRRVMVSRAGDGRPMLLISGSREIADRVAIRVSISHSGPVAVACVVAWAPRPVRSEPDPLHAEAT